MVSSFDLTPLFRYSVGFDRIADMFDLMQEGVPNTSSGYPPYNIERHGENTYHIVMAVAGFSDEDLSINFQDNQLTIQGKTKKANHKDDVEYLHKGIANRGFEHKFQLADHIRVVDAALENGLLRIELLREVPEALKPRSISIKTNNTKTIEGSAE
jgi:molecular chaperone IbpA